MCGIAGILSSASDVINHQRLQKMTDALQHRGPDGDGFWISEHKRTGIAHRRLAIIDLSAAAAQPMHYLNRYTITYNGEIYNYIELKQSLQQAGYIFTNSSDTEVILAAYDFYAENCLTYFDGMFAFAIWDEKEQTLFCARDRFGEKPFYYFADKDIFCFASEMKALWAIGVEKNIDLKMLLNYLSLGHVQNATDNSQTFYKSIQSLSPGHYLQFRMANMDFTINKYYTLNKDICKPVKEADAVAIFSQLLATSVKRKLRSDVPLGCSLSGGLDSSSIAWQMQQLKKGNDKYKSFTAIFPGFEKDEASHATLVSKHLNFDAYTVNPTAAGLINDFEKLFYHQEEPFPSSSIYAQYKVYELAAKQNVRVMLDGQGADEILGGYHKYIHWFLQELLTKYKWPLYAAEREAFKKNNVSYKWGFKNFLAAAGPSHTAIILEKREYNKIMTAQYLTPEILNVVRGRNWEGIHKPIVTKLNDMLHFNTVELGLEELLRYADRNSMAHGVEVRLPFLNAELVKFVFSLPSTLKIHDGFTKYVLRKAMENNLPSATVWRTDKVGFEAPQKQWMTEPTLIDYTHEAKKLLVKEKILQPGVLKQADKSIAVPNTANHDWQFLCAAQLIK